MGIYSVFISLLFDIRGKQLQSNSISLEFGSKQTGPPLTPNSFHVCLGKDFSTNGFGI